ncbi:MAG: IS66 family transposase [Verrucomicrobiales bacterium]
MDGPCYCTETVQKYQKRFTRFRDSLFTFIEVDGVLWENNTAERALRHLAVQRKISGQFGKQHAKAYLVLLGVAQTCRFQGKSFLHFLLSKTVDIDGFESGKRRNRPSPISIPK